MKNPLVSIIIQNFNGEKVIEKCLDSVLKTHYKPFEVLVVDSKSDDNSIRLIREKYGKNKLIRLIALKKDNGYTYGNNVGAKFSKGKYLIFLNPDAIVTPEWADSLVDFCEKNEELKIGSLQSKILLIDKHTIDTTGDFCTYFISPFNRGFREDDISNYNEVCEVFSGASSSMLVIREDFLKIGGFDTEFNVLLSDVDYGWRCRLLGYKNFYINNSLVYHDRSSTYRSKPSYKRSYEEAKSILYLILKNTSSAHMITVFPLRVTMILVKILTSIIKGNYQVAKAYIDAFKNTAINKSLIFAKRIAFNRDFQPNHDNLDKIFNQSMKYEKRKIIRLLAKSIRPIVKIF